MDDRLMTVKETCAYLNVKERAIYKWLASGFIPARRYGRVWRFSKEKLDKWGEEQGTRGRIRSGRVNQYI